MADGVGMKQRALFDVLGVFEREGTWRFQPGNMKRHLGFLEDDVTHDVINVDDQPDQNVD